MNTQQEKKQKALFSLASFAVGLKRANHEGQTAALEEAREHKVTNTEWLRECVRLKTLDAVNLCKEIVMQTEPGDFSDNLEIFLTAVYNLKHGAPNDGLQMINDLRNRIVSTGEVKSNTWLLPQLDFYLCAARREGTGNIKRRSASALNLKGKLQWLASKVWCRAKTTRG